MSTKQQMAKYADDPTPWAMLAMKYHERLKKGKLEFPYLVQPKLNGIRARWYKGVFTTRQGKTIPEHVLPSAYRDWSNTATNGFPIDGELYIHGCPLQELHGIVNSSRNEPHPRECEISFMAFDLILKMPALDRRALLGTFYSSSYLTHAEAFCEADVQRLLENSISRGFEGLMLRTFSTPYLIGRTDALLKVKPAIKIRVRLTGTKEGLGMFRECLGAFVYTMDNHKQGKVSGGLTHEQRLKFWKDPPLGDFAEITFFEYSTSGIPLQPRFTDASLLGL